MLDSCKMVKKQSEAFHTFLWHFFPSLKQNFIAYCSSKVSACTDCIFEIHQLWQSGFSRVYSNCCCSCSFEPEIIKIGLSSHKMYSNNIVNFQESMIILNACTKKSGNLLNEPHTTWLVSLWPNQVMRPVRDSTLNLIATKSGLKRVQFLSTVSKLKFYNIGLKKMNGLFGLIGHYKILYIVIICMIYFFFFFFFFFSRFVSLKAWMYIMHEN